MKYIQSFSLFEAAFTKDGKKSKRKLGKFAKHCISLGYSGCKNGKCYGKKKEPIDLKFDKDYFYDVELNSKK